MSPGQTISHYRIIEQIGEGGMGVVYKAKDTNLDRTVALKFLAAHMLESDEYKKRFLREAKAAASLDHPNICTIHEVGEAEGRLFLALSFVDGPDVSAKIKERPLKLEEALDIAIQTAEGLRAAHHAGVVHRDVKSSNLMLTATGQVKVMDFGLAQLGGGSRLTQSNTRLGTPAYMSPEQAQAFAVDARTDIWSLGVVLYEMVTGRLPFAGEVEQGVVHLIIHEPHEPITAIRSGVPLELDRIVGKALAKNPSERYQHIDDMLLDLRMLRGQVGAARPGSGQSVVGSGVNSSRGKLLAAAALAVAIVAAGVALLLRREPVLPELTPITRLTRDTGLTTDPAISPDGKLVAYASDRGSGDNLDLWVQQFDGGASPLRLTNGPADESEPDFSPDGNLIAFRSGLVTGGIYVIGALGGEARLIARTGRQPRFSPDGTRLAFVIAAGGAGGVYNGTVHVTPASGGAIELLSSSTEGAANPVWSPDGKSILFATGVYRPDDWAIVPATPGKNSPQIILRLQNLKKQQGLADLLPYKWLPGNQILFSAKSGDSSHLFLIGLTPPSLLSKEWRLAAAPRRVTSGTEHVELPSVAVGDQAGGLYRLIFASHDRSDSLWSLPLDADHPSKAGMPERLTQGGGFHIFPSISADGKKVVYISHAPYNDEPWLLDLTSGRKSLLSSEVSPKFKTRIHRDGSRVMFQSGGIESGRINWVPTMGGVPEKLCEPCTWPWDWSSDYKRILTWDSENGSSFCRIVNFETGKIDVYLQRGGTHFYQFRWSPDGRWIAFVTERENRRQVYTAPYGGDVAPSEENWIPITGGMWTEDKLNWSPNGNWIYSLSGRDGYLCIWAYPLDPSTKRPAGEPLAVLHSHGVRQGLRHSNRISQEMSVAQDKIVFNQADLTGNVWKTSFRLE